jgi:integration host factor subunit alpha
MTKADLVESICTRANISKKDSADVLEEVFSVMKDTLASGEKIKIAGFGNFEVNQKKARKGRNPQTGGAITIDARKVLTFKPSSVLKQTINCSAE